MILAFHKPFGVLSQFTVEQDGQRTLAEFGFPKHVYPIGRLDADSEGLLLLSDEKEVVDRLLDPKHKHPRTYWAQVEGIPDVTAIATLMEGPVIGGYRTLPCKAWLLDPQPLLDERIPPVRVRLRIPTAWIALELHEGKNRQVRRMTAAAGHPTLRLLRVAIGAFPLGTLEAGAWSVLTEADRRELFRK